MFNLRLLLGVLCDAKLLLGPKILKLLILGITALLLRPPRLPRNWSAKKIRTHSFGETLWVIIFLELSHLLSLQAFA